MLLKKTILLSFFTLLSHSIFSQNGPAKENFWSNVRYGGNFGLGFSNGGFNASISPSALYQFNEQFATGTSLSFNYAKYDDQKLIAYGGSILSLFNPIPQLQISAEFEQLRINRTIDTPTTYWEDNYWSPALFVGFGYSTYNVTFGVRYDLLYNNDKSIYGDALMPFVRVYF